MRSRIQLLKKKCVINCDRRSFRTNKFNFLSSFLLKWWAYFSWAKFNLLFRAIKEQNSRRFFLRRNLILIVNYFIPYYTSLMLVNFTKPAKRLVRTIYNNMVYILYKKTWTYNQISSSFEFCEIIEKNLLTIQMVK